MKITHFLSFGKRYALFVCVLFFSSFIFGQTIVQYSFNNNLNHDATPVPPAGTTLVFKGSNHAVKSPQYDNNRLVSTATNDYLELTINTTGLTGMTLSFDASFSGIGWGSWTVFTSNGNSSGNNWNNYVEIGDITFGLFLGNSGNITIPIPAASENKTNVKFRIRSNFFSLGQTLRIDNLKISKTSANITVSTDTNLLIPHNSNASLNFNTDFGDAIVVESNKLSPYFRIRNINGTGVLNITQITTSGLNASDFTIENISTFTLNPSSSITSNPYSQFRIRFSPTGDGLRRAMVTIYSNGNQNPYSFEIVGQGASCSLFTTPYVINTFNPDINEPSLPSTFTAANIVTGTAQSNNVVRMYPDGELSLGSDNSSLYVRNTTTVFEFGGANGIDVSGQKDVSIVFDLGAYFVDNNNENRGPNRDSYILLKVEHNETYTDEVKLIGSNNANGYSYKIASSTNNRSSFETIYDMALNEIYNRDEGFFGTTKYRYNTIRLNIPASKISADPTLKFKLEVRNGTSSRVWVIDNVRIEVSNSIFTEFNNGVWSNGTPSSSKKTLIKNGTLNVPSQGYQMCECEVMENGSVIVPENRILTVKGKIINHHDIGDNFVVQNNGNIIQNENGAVNIGKITVFRNSEKMVRQDATFWSSPVSGQNLRSFSPNTLLKRFYLYNKYSEAGATSDYKSILEYDVSYPMPNPIPENWYDEGELNGNIFNPSTYTFKKGWGYTIRVANNWSTNNPTAYEGKFVGTPNNGDIEVPVYGKFTVVGNPYPSNISYHVFMDFNPEVNSIHFWTHKFPVGSEYYDYGYLTVNKMGTTGLFPDPEGGDSISVPYTSTIKVGQGFLIRNSALANTQTEWSVQFNNEMRLPTTGGVFYKNFDEPEAHKFWLGLYDQNEVKIAQILLGYMQGATNEFDKQYDAERMGSSPLFSIMDEGKMAIQARALPFQHTDVILLGFVAKYTGTYKIGLDDMTGLFDDGQDIYIKDKQANVVHNLSESDYSFEANQGTYHHRFEIIYKKKPILTKSIGGLNKIEIDKVNKNIEINSTIDKITSIQVFNISGRLLMEENEINKLNYSIQTSGIEPSIIIVRGVTETGETFNQKFIIN